MLDDVVAADRRPLARRRRWQGSGAERHRRFIIGGVSGYSVRTEAASEIRGALCAARSQPAAMHFARGSRIMRCPLFGQLLFLKETKHRCIKIEK